MATPVRRDEVVDYQTYEETVRPVLRPRVLAQKEARRVLVGEYLTFLFENHDTVLYQVQEMLRAERIVKEGDIAHEIATYNELLGGPGELGATLLIAVAEEERPVRLRDWRDLPEFLYLKLEGGGRIPARFDTRQLGGERLSSVQYLRFDTRGRVPVAVGVDHPLLQAETVLSSAQREALAADLSG